MFEAVAPTSYPLADKDKASSAAIIRDFRMLPRAWPSGGAPVDTVVLTFSREGPGARVKVYAHGGSEHARQSLLVAELTVAEGQEFSVTQLAAYGVEPLTLSVVRRAEVELVPPRVESKAPSVEVGEIKVRPEVPSFEPVLRDASRKEWMAVALEDYRNSRPQGAPPSYDWRMGAAVEPGRTLSVTLEFGWSHKLTAEGHAVEPTDRVVIRSALFADGSYEGESGFAARAEALRVGRRAQLSRALELLRAAAESGGDHASVRELASRVGALECEAEWTQVSELAGRYGLFHGDELEKLKAQIEAGMKLQRATVLAELNAYVARVAPATDPAVTRAWLKALAVRYEKLLPGV